MPEPTLNAGVIPDRPFAVECRFSVVTEPTDGRALTGVEPGVASSCPVAVARSLVTSSGKYTRPNVCVCEPPIRVLDDSLLAPTTASVAEQTVLHAGVDVRVSGTVTRYRRRRRAAFTAAPRDQSLPLTTRAVTRPLPSLLTRFSPPLVDRSPGRGRNDGTSVIVTRPRRTDEAWPRPRGSVARSSLFVRTPGTVRRSRRRRPLGLSAISDVSVLAICGDSLARRLSLPNLGFGTLVRPPPSEVGGN